jgi:hypothetical protein
VGLSAVELQATPPLETFPDVALLNDSLGMASVYRGADVTADEVRLIDEVARHV